jgi:cell division septal protein FtsQ
LVTLIVMGGIGVLLVARFWDRLRGDFVERNPLFAIKTIEITTNGRWITPQQVRAWADVREGENLLLLDLQRIKHDLEIIPQLEGITIERVPPHLLRISVTEREPVAQVRGVQWTASGEVAPVTYFLDPKGMVMPPLPAGSVPAEGLVALSSLPAVAGLDGRELRPGQPIKSRQVLAALALVRAFDSAAVGQVASLATVDVSDPEVLVVRTGEGSEITLHPQGLDLQLRRWWAVHEAGLRSSNVIATLDLSLTNYCPVVWAPAASQPPPAPKPATIEPKRQRHA